MPASVLIMRFGVLFPYRKDYSSLDLDAFNCYRSFIKVIKILCTTVTHFKFKRTYQIKCIVFANVDKN